MRTILTTAILTGTVATALVAAPAVAGAAPAARVTIDHRTSAFYQYDGSPLGTGPTADAVAVHAQLRNCPAGNYIVDASLVQDGISYPVASTALGSGELYCSGASITPLVTGFTGDGLHPGRAKVSITVYREADGMPVLTTASGTVRIPDGPNNPA